MLCPACAAGLKGIDGHPQIEPDSQPPDKAQARFRCAACGTRYKRMYEGSGVFVWMKVADAPNSRA
jgi:hypothetical protein